MSHARLAVASAHKCTKRKFQKPSIPGIARLLMCLFSRHNKRADLPCNVIQQVNAQITHIKQDYVGRREQSCRPSRVGSHIAASQSVGCQVGSLLEAWPSVESPASLPPSGLLSIQAEPWGVALGSTEGSRLRLGPKPVMTGPASTANLQTTTQASAPNASLGRHCRGRVGGCTSHISAVAQDSKLAVRYECPHQRARHCVTVRLWSIEPDRKVW